MTKNIVLDLGGVMINYDPRGYIEKLPINEDKKDSLYDAIFHNEDLWIKSDYGAYPHYSAMVEDFQSLHPELKEEIDRFFAPDWVNVYSLIPEGQSLFSLLYEAGYEIYILSNFMPDVFQVIYRKFDFFRKIKGYVVSSYEKVRKPEKAIYDILLKRYALNPDECLFIDDNEANVKSAIELGMPSLCHKNPADTIQELRRLGILAK